MAKAKDSAMDMASFKMSEKGCQLDCWLYESGIHKRGLSLMYFFFKFSVLFKMCWATEAISDLGNCREYKWESKWNMSNHEGFSEYIRIQVYSVETWWASQPVYLRTAEDEKGWEHMAQQLGIINLIGPAAWELSYGEDLVGKSWILLRDQGIHRDVKWVRQD